MSEAEGDLKLIKSKVDELESEITELEERKTQAAIDGDDKKEIGLAEDISDTYFLFYDADGEKDALDCLIVDLRRKKKELEIYL